MDAETLERAHWVKSSPHGWMLKQPIGDGGAVLATISEHFLHNEWCLSDGRYGVHRSLYGAMRAARKALREAGSG